MHFFRKYITHRKLASILAIGMLLRSIVAVGYMLDTNPADGGLLSIKLCDGPAGINAIAGQDDHSQHHGHNEHHGHHDQDDEHEHASQDHAFSSCSFWSASSQLLLANNLVFNTSSGLLSHEIILYKKNFFLQSSNTLHLARAPPVLI